MSTKIEWVKNPDGTQGDSWNPITGCLNGCLYCYARKLANGWLKSHYLANKNVALESAYKYAKEIPEGDYRFIDPFFPRFWPGKINELTDNCWKNVERRKPRGYFVCDMSDLFGMGVPEDWTRQVLEVMRNRYYDRFYLLTKQPQNLPKWSPFPKNCWVGVSATNHTTTVQALLRLSQIQATVNFVSFEPLLSGTYVLPEDFKMAGISWLVIGAQTKPTVLPQISWVREIVDAADKAGIPVFLKNNLRDLLGKSNWEWAFNRLGNGLTDGRLRQELPAVKPCES